MIKIQIINNEVNKKQWKIIISLNKKPWKGSNNNFAILNFKTWLVLKTTLLSFYSQAYSSLLIPLQSTILAQCSSDWWTTAYFLAAASNWQHWTWNETEILDSISICLLFRANSLPASTDLSRLAQWSTSKLFESLLLGKRTHTEKERL